MCSGRDDYNLLLSCGANSRNFNYLFRLESFWDRLVIEVIITKRSVFRQLSKGYHYQNKKLTLVVKNTIFNNIFPNQHLSMLNHKKYENKIQKIYLNRKYEIYDFNDIHDFLYFHKNKFNTFHRKNNLFQVSTFHKPEGMNRIWKILWNLIKYTFEPLP